MITKKHRISFLQLARITFLSSLLSASALVGQAQSFTYSNDFSGFTSDTNITETPGSETGYFYGSGFGTGFSEHDASGKGLLFNAVGRLRTNWNYASPGGAAFAFRDFTDDGLLATGHYLVNPQVTTAVTWQYGGGTDNKLWNYIGIVDAAGNGYVAGIARNGEAAIYQVEGGLGNNFASWGTPLASKTFTSTATAATGNWTTLDFSISGNTLTFTTSRAGGTSDSLSVTLSALTYSEFTTVALGSRMVASERADYDYLNVIATTATAIPEPTTSAIGLGALALLFAGAWSRVRMTR